MSLRVIDVTILENSHLNSPIGHLVVEAKTLLMINGGGRLALSLA